MQGRAGRCLRFAGGTSLLPCVSCYLPGGDPVDEHRVARADLHEFLKRLTREGNQIRSVVPDDDVFVVVSERRTEIREGV